MEIQGIGGGVPDGDLLSPGSHVLDLDEETQLPLHVASNPDPGPHGGHVVPPTRYRLTAHGSRPNLSFQVHHRPGLGVAFGGAQQVGQDEDDGKRRPGEHELR